MVLANRTRVQNSRTLLRAFGGLNEGYGCSEAEYSAGINFSSRDFPALSTRKPRRKLRTLTGLNGMYHLNGLLTVCGKDLVYTPDDGGPWETVASLTAREARRSYDLPLVPRRHSTLRLRLRGKGQITLRSLAKNLAAAKGGLVEEQEEATWQV